MPASSAAVASSPVLPQLAMSPAPTSTTGGTVCVLAGLGEASSRQASTATGTDRATSRWRKPSMEPPCVVLAGLRARRPEGCLVWRWRSTVRSVHAAAGAAHSRTCRPTQATFDCLISEAVFKHADDPRLGARRTHRGPDQQSAGATVTRTRRTAVYAVNLCHPLGQPAATESARAPHRARTRDQAGRATALLRGSRYCRWT